MFFHSWDCLIARVWRVFDLPLRKEGRPYDGLPLLNIMPTRPILGQIFLPLTRYRLSAEAGTIVREFLSPSSPSEVFWLEFCRAIQLQNHDLVIQLLELGQEPNCSGFAQPMDSGLPRTIWCSFLPGLAKKPTTYVLSTDNHWWWEWEWAWWCYDQARPQTQ